MKKFLTQGHSPVKQNTLEQKQVSSTSKARLVHTAATKVFYLFFHLKLGISYFFFQSLYFLCQSLFNDKTRQGWTMETQKRHKNGCYKLITVECHAVTDKCGRGINTQRNCRDCTGVPEQSSPCLLLLGFQLVGVLPLILFFHPSRGSLKRAEKQQKLDEKSVLLKPIHKILFCYHITSHHQPQESTVGPGRRNKQEE